MFRPIPTGQLAAAVGFVLDGFRRDSLNRAGIRSRVPIAVTENGWPTGPGRSEERQAEVLAEIVQTIYNRRDDINICGYTYFGLRDADSTGTDLFHGFGLLRDDYTPKPAFDVYRRVITGQAPNSKPSRTNATLH